jgi:uncharacterized beta-barrel protein YwiB (DUF1934 family)
MDTISSGKVYPTVPGQRYAIAFSNVAASGTGIITLTWKADSGGTNGNFAFKLADGTTTSVTADIGGWEIVAPTNSIQIAVSENFEVSVIPIKN